MLEVDGDELLDSAGAVLLVGTGAVVARIPVVIDRAGACERVLTAVADASITNEDLCKRSRRDGARDTRAA